MATKQHSSRANSRKRVPTFSKRSDWAAGMNGADPEWLHSREAKRLAQVFDGVFPAWLIESEPWRQISGERFKFFRQTLLGLDTEQCAAYLGVHRSTIGRWESNDVEMPKAAFEALRLQYQIAAQRISHKQWDGWFLNRKTGELVSPDKGRLAVTADEINALPELYGCLSELKIATAQQAELIKALQAENTALRTTDKSRQVADELEAMQERISELLSSVRTAEVIEFNPAPAEKRRASR